MPIWSEEEIKKLIELSNQQLPVRKIAETLDKTYDAVRAKRKNLIIKKIDSKKIEYSIPKKEELAYSLPIEKFNLKSKELDKLIIQSLKDKLRIINSFLIPDTTQVKVDTGDTLVIQLTDLHAGKIVKDQEGKIIYNEETFRNRINCLCEQILKLLDTNISKGVKIDEVVILSTGDLANGEGIYSTQAFEQEIAPPSQVMLVVEVITKLILSLLERKLIVRFYGIRGNHGRTGKDTDVASNWDLMIYMILDFWSKYMLKNINLQIKYAETEYLRCDIRNHGYLIRHICPEQVDSPAGRVKINEWARKHKVEAIVYGHYHHGGIFDCDNVRVFRGPSIVGGDSLSDSMAKHSEPMQLIWGVNETRISTFIYFVDLGEK